MGTIPLRIDTDLVNQARASGSLSDRPPTAQIEFWAKIGRVMEAVLTGDSIVAIKQLARVEDVEKVLALTRTEKGRQRARAIIARHKGPVYSADPDDSQVVIETLPDGIRRRGKFANRRFTVLSSASVKA